VTPTNVRRVTLLRIPFSFISDELSTMAASVRSQTTRVNVSNEPVSNCKEVAYRPPNKWDRPLANDPLEHRLEADVTPQTAPLVQKLALEQQTAQHIARLNSAMRFRA
jgi:hypothetical protein